MYRFSTQLLLSTAGALVAMGAPFEDPRIAGDSEGTRAATDGAMSTDVTFVQHCGYWSHYDPKARTSAWPLPHGLTAGEMATYGTLYGALRDEPRAGDIFLQWAPRVKSVVHVGIVVEVLASGRFSPTHPYHDVYTLEGDTDALGRRRGGRSMRVRRRLSAAQGDRYLRWTAMEFRDVLLPQLAQAPLIVRRTA